jgi:hypothetical protein
MVRRSVRSRFDPPRRSTPRIGSISSGNVNASSVTILFSRPRGVWRVKDTGSAFVRTPFALRPRRRQQERRMPAPASERSSDSSPFGSPIFSTSAAAACVSPRFAMSAAILRAGSAFGGIGGCAQQRTCRLGGRDHIGCRSCRIWHGRNGPTHRSSTTAGHAGPVDGPTVRRLTGWTPLLAGSRQ